MSVRVSSRLGRSRHGTVYVFRFSVPEPLRQWVGRSEVRLSLGTEVRQDAVVTSHALGAALPALMASLRHFADNKQHLVNPTIYFQAWLQQVRDNARLRGRIEALEQEVDTHQLEALHQRQQLAASVPRARAASVAKQAHTLGQLRGHTRVEEMLVFPWPPGRTKLFSELLTAYLAHFTYRAQGGIKKPPGSKTLAMYKADIGTFVDVMGDDRIGAIDREYAGTFFNILRKLPPNISRTRRLQGKTIDQILAVGLPPQTEHNASKKMERISAMIKWALLEKRKWGIDENPFSGYSQDGTTKSPRRPFTTDEWLVLLGHRSFAERRFELPYMYWLIPLAAYTGARLGELCQLDLKDFVEVEGVACIDINDEEAPNLEGEGGRKKRVKTRNAKRLVPIHPELVRLGFLRYVAAMRAKRQVHLFPELSRTRRDGPGHAASNWFQRFRKSVGLTEKQATVFHSFRHGFITKLLDAGVAPHSVAPIVGHEADLITGKVYWNKQDARARNPTVLAFTLGNDVAQLFPLVEDVRFVPRKGLSVPVKARAATPTAKS